MRNGFTLIELLAVIVILAIIALIATPVVLSIIEDTKQSAMLRSAEMYITGVEHAIMKENMNNGGNFRPTKCDINNGSIKCDDKDLIPVEVDGEVPSDGTIIFENGKIKEVTLNYQSGTIVKDSNGELVYEGSESVKTLDTICTHDTTNGVQARTAGAKYSCEVKEGTSYNFYVLTTPEEGETTINLIMDRNICEDGTPATAENKCFVAYNSSGDAAGVGPVTAMTYLNNATSTWENIDNLDITYDDESGHFKGFVLNGKARLPYKSEVSNYDSTNKTNAYLYDYLNQSGTIQTNAISGITGYWTLSSDTVFSIYACYVYYGGSVYSVISVDSDTSLGVRPVITIKL